MKNPKHFGPHCAGYCEGASYNITIRQLKNKIAQLKSKIAELEDIVKEQEEELFELRHEVGQHT